MSMDRQNSTMTSIPDTTMLRPDAVPFVPAEVVKNQPQPQRKATSGSTVAEVIVADMQSSPFGRKKGQQQHTQKQKPKPKQFTTVVEGDGGGRRKAQRRKNQHMQQWQQQHPQSRANEYKLEHEECYPTKTIQRQKQKQHLLQQDDDQPGKHQRQPRGTINTRQQQQQLRGRTAKNEKKNRTTTMNVPMENPGTNSPMKTHHHHHHHEQPPEKDKLLWMPSTTDTATTEGGSSYSSFCTNAFSVPQQSFNETENVSNIAFKQQAVTPESSWLKAVIQQNNNNHTKNNHTGGHCTTTADINNNTAEPLCTRETKLQLVGSCTTGTTTLTKLKPSRKNKCAGADNSVTKMLSTSPPSANNNTTVVASSAEDIPGCCTSVDTEVLHDHSSNVILTSGGSMAKQNKNSSNNKTMTRLRNRWWDLLQKHYENNINNHNHNKTSITIQQKQDNQEQQEQEEKLTVGELISAIIVDGEMNNIQQQQHEWNRRNQFEGPTTPTTIQTATVFDSTSKLPNPNGTTCTSVSAVVASSASTRIDNHEELFDKNHSTGFDHRIRDAVLANDCCTLKRLLLQGNEVNDTITSTSSRNQQRIVQTVLGLSATSNCADRSTYSENFPNNCTTISTPFELAVKLNRPELVKIIFDALFCAISSTTFITKYNQDSIDEICWWTSDPRYEQQLRTMLFTSIEFGYDECIEIICLNYSFLRYSSSSSLSSSSSSVPPVMTLKDEDGNTALHHCCSTTCTSLSTFRILFEYILKTGSSSVSSGSTGNSSSAHATKILSMKNKRQEQTPLHLACRFGRADIFEYILNRMGNYAALSKLLAIQDSKNQTPLLTAVAAGSTDIVMSLLMWRGNNSLHHRYRYIVPSATLSSNTRFSSSSKRMGTIVPTTSTSSTNGLMLPPPCPLLWAVTQSRSADMVSLLLEFNNPTSDSGYNLDNALRAAVHMRLQWDKLHHHIEDVEGEEEDDSRTLCIVQLLIEAGANPCSLPVGGTSFSSPSIKINDNPISCAVRNGDVECLAMLLDTYRSHLDSVQSSRRRDPKLQKQPETFFHNLESRENGELNMIMRDSLVASLYYSWKHISPSNDCAHQPESKFLSCCLILYRRHAGLNLNDLERLKSSLKASILIPSTADITDVPPNPEYEASHYRLVPKVNNEVDMHLAAQASSLAMLKLPWCSLLHQSKKSIGCMWVEDQCQIHDQNVLNSLEEDTLLGFSAPDVILLCLDGSQFLAHSIILSEYSQKLAAAIRFASLSSLDIQRESQDGKTLIKVDISVPAKKLRWMLEHMYHGSIVVGRFSYRTFRESVDDLLELLLIADEYLCPSLIQECEMRLLATDFRRCFCWYCNPTSRSFLQSDTTTQPTLWQRVKCTFTIIGPSVLIAPEDALDVLAVTDQLRTSLHDISDFSFRIISNKAVLNCKTSSGTTYLTTTSASRRPLESIREFAVGTLLQNLDKVIGMSSFGCKLQQLFMIEDSSSTTSNICGRTFDVLAFEILLDILLKELYVLVSS